MTFRLRVLALVALVAVTAVGATAYLAYFQASRQVTESAAADRQTVLRVVDELSGYARRHGTWEGVTHTVRALYDATGQRLKLVTQAGDVVDDTDTQAGRRARPVTDRSTVVDPRPTLTLPGLGKPAAARPAATRVPRNGLELSPLPTPERTEAGLLIRSAIEARRDPWGTTLREIRRYRYGVRYAACLTRQGLTALVTKNEYGLPVYVENPEASEKERHLATACRMKATSTDRYREQETAVRGCKDLASAHLCLRQVFAEQTSDVAPVPLMVYFGAIGDPGRPLEPGPVIAAAAVVALLALAGTALLSRRVLRPIGTLTAASQRVGAGDLSLRVPVSGRDELAQLARSFNRMADSLQRGEERQRRLVADVAHELRTPLANLRGYLEALKDGVIPPGSELFASLHEEAVLQQRIVDDLQDLALAEAGALAYHRTRIDLAELLETCRAAHQAAAGAAGVALHVQADGPVIVTADPDRLRQVIGNLLANALRATPAGGSVTLSAARPVDGAATVVVRDTGTGIAAADLPHVFDRFWRADPARGRATGGAGLGLAIARQIVTDHGGHIAADSHPGTGTVVTITLPASPDEGSRHGSGPSGV
jgi:two-component system, OmpR family, sensor histidine kinase BaeS